MPVRRSSDKRDPASHASASYSKHQHLLVPTRPSLQSHRKQRTTKALHGDHGVLKLFFVVNHDLFVSSFTDNDTSVTPAEIVHTPERVNRKEKAVNRIPGRHKSVKTTLRRGGQHVRDQVHNKPSDEHELAFQNENYCLTAHHKPSLSTDVQALRPRYLKTVDTRDKCKGDNGDGRVSSGYSDNEPQQLEVMRQRHIGAESSPALT